MYVEIMASFNKLFQAFLCVCFLKLCGLRAGDLWKPYIINGATSENEYLLIIIIIDYDDC